MVRGPKGAASLRISVSDAVLTLVPPRGMPSTPDIDGLANADDDCPARHTVSELPLLSRRRVASC